MDGAEVVQLYVSAKNPTIYRPVKELKGFAKVFLKAGENKTVTIKLDDKAFRYFNVLTDEFEIDRGIGKCEPQDKPGSDSEGLPTRVDEARQRTVFEPYKGKKRKRGTGCVTQIGEHLWEGRYSPKWPDGKIHSRNVYADSSEECEAKLAELIRQMKAEIAEAKELTVQGKLDETMALANGKKPRGTRRKESRL